MIGPPSTQIDLRSSLDPVGIINDPWQALHSKIEQIFLKKMLAKKKLESNFEHFLKEIDFSKIVNKRIDLPLPIWSNVSIKYYSGDRKLAAP